MNRLATSSFTSESCPLAERPPSAPRAHLDLLPVRLLPSQSRPSASRPPARLRSSPPGASFHCITPARDPQLTRQPARRPQRHLDPVDGQRPGARVPQSAPRRAAQLAVAHLPAPAHVHVVDRQPRHGRRPLGGCVPPSPPLLARPLRALVRVLIGLFTSITPRPHLASPLLSMPARSHVRPLPRAPRRAPRRRRARLGRHARRMVQPPRLGPALGKGPRRRPGRVPHPERVPPPRLGRRLLCVGSFSCESTEEGKGGSQPRLPSLLLSPSRTRTDTSRTPRPQSSSSSRPTWPATPSSAPRPSRPRPSSRSERLDPTPPPSPRPLVVPPSPPPSFSTAVPTHPEETSDPRCAARACNACTSSPSSRSSARVSVRDLDRPARAPVFKSFESESSWTGEAKRERAGERPACTASATCERGSLSPRRSSRRCTPRTARAASFSSLSVPRTAP